MKLHLARLVTLFSLLVFGGMLNVMAHGIAEDRLHDLEHEIEDHPDDPALYVKRGRIHRDSEQWDSALKSYRKALAIDPDHHEAKYWRADSLFLKGDYRQAGRQLEEYLQQKPDSAAGYRLMAQVQKAQGQFRSAADYFDLSIAHDANPPPQIYRERAQALMQANPVPVKRIESGLAEGLARHEANIALLSLFIEVKIKAGDLAGALQLIEELPAGLNATPYWLNKKAGLEKLAGDHQKAARDYQAVLDNISALPKYKQSLPAFVAAQEQAQKGLKELLQANR